MRRLAGSPSKFFLLLAIAVCTEALTSSVNASAQLQQRGLTLSTAAASAKRDVGSPALAAAGPQGVDQRTLVMRRAAEQLEVTREAEAESEVNSKSLLATQQQLAAQLAAEAGEDAARVDAETIPDAKDALAAVRGYAIVAQAHANHAKEVQAEYKLLPKQAAEAAAKAVRDQLRTEAYGAAEAAGFKTAAEAPMLHRQKVIEAAAAAIEPYHLALLRAQKGAAEDEAKARSAALSSGKLATEAQRLATMAQGLQTSGLSVQAAQTMSVAHTTAQQSVDMREYAVKLHDEAGKLLNSLNAYQSYERQAAEHAVRNIGTKFIPVLPTREPEEPM